MIAEERTGKCPDCNTLRTYLKQSGDTLIPWPSEHLKSCPKFRAMSPKDKAKRIEDANGCLKCTSWNHQQDRCFVITEACLKCDHKQHMLLHGSGNRFCDGIATTDISQSLNGGWVILLMQEVYALGTSQD